MKNLELNQMENLQGGNAMDCQRTIVLSLMTGSIIGGHWFGLLSV